MLQLAHFGGLDFHSGLFAIEAVEDPDGEGEDCAPTETAGGKQECRCPSDDVGDNG